MSAATAQPGFLDRHLEPHERGAAGHLFHLAVRAGAADPRAVVQDVLAETSRQISTPHLDPERRDRVLRLRTAILADPEGAAAFARHAIEWNQLKPSERARIKALRAAQARLEYMREQPPTEPQRDYLKVLGHDGEPANRAEASELIDQLRGGKQ